MLFVAPRSVRLVTVVLPDFVCKRWAANGLGSVMIVRAHGWIAGRDLVMGPADHHAGESYKCMSTSCLSAD